ncbi:MULTISPECIES: hypothetical protein [Bacteroidota]|uniref:Uncharacterized protein n=3 Tax=Sphingobacteriaceae TaxID=84566 RepID=A0A081PHR1_9SPHI|nr:MULTISPECIES: hypothetical protein [Bacteroidota]KEQ30234.1 hypothetical protein N180_06800 [Pedobacter antarcticus 4BY]MBA8986385.1 hypothetical protein [Sphingobacterium soli]WGQ12871.1 hypothetical protein QG727_12625 [Sphingobacterium faecium]SFE52446.1 hypothetical protein SAMN03003324_00771 [Pedobacter antarcticus]GGE19808.1 hypothetical protein GCM10011516_16830 [Sphingobacterium soli]
MEEIDLTKIKYYPDRFYICLDGFDIENLTDFLTDLQIGQHQSIFIHEYYHYLTNIATLPGIRQFCLNFCDRFRASTILTATEGINAYPINTNTFQSCKNMVDYWNDVAATLSEDDIDYKVVEDTNNATNKKFGIASIEKTHRSMEVIVDGVKHTGERHFITIHTTGLINVHSFNLTFGAIDEFLSSAIDEYLFENDLSDINPSMLSQRPFYPYCFFDEILSFYGMKRPSAFEKILIAYFALNSSNPPVVLIEILEKLRDGGYEQFLENPETYLLSNFSETPQYNDVLNNIKYFADLTSQQGRVHISQALKYYYDKFYVAQKVKENDFFFFVRPFFVSDENTIKYKQKFLLELSRILNLFTPPLILKDKQFFYIDKLTTFGEATVLILATYEIFESLRTNRFASRPAYQKAKYTFPDRDPDCDNFEKFTPPPINGVAFRLALNELNLYGLYLQELENLKQTNS